MQAKIRRLSPVALRRYLRTLKWLHFCEYWSTLPFSIRISLVHAGVTAFYLFHSPPIEKIPPLFIPIVWAASLASTITIWNVGKMTFRRIAL